MLCASATLVPPAERVGDGGVDEDAGQERPDRDGHEHQSQTNERGEECADGEEECADQYREGDGAEYGEEQRRHGAGRLEEGRLGEAVTAVGSWLRMGV